MDQEQLFSLALGLVPPWLVDDVTFKVEDKRLDLKRSLSGVISQTPPSHHAVALWIDSGGQDEAEKHGGSQGFLLARSGGSPRGRWTIGSAVLCASGLGPLAVLLLASAITGGFQFFLGSLEKTEYKTR